MKTSPPVFQFPILAALIVAGTPLLPADEVKMASGQVMRDAATHDELSARLAQAKDPIRELQQLKAKEAANPPRPAKVPDLFDSSDFLCFSGEATLVPKGAILHVPKDMQDRMHYNQGSTIKTWSDFLPTNRAWITTVEVNRLQAEGNAMLSEATLKEIAKSPQVVIATLQGGPISVMPPRVPAAPAAGQATPTSANR